MKIGVAGLSEIAIRVLGQMFVYGPTWDGNLLAKNGRDELVKAGLASKANGFNFLTRDGVQIASEWKFIRTDSHLEQCWARKVSCR